MRTMLLLLVLALAGCSADAVHTTGILLGALAGQQLAVSQSLSQQSAAFNQRQLYRQDQFFQDHSSD